MRGLVFPETRAAAGAAEGGAAGGAGVLPKSENKTSTHTAMVQKTARAESANSEGDSASMGSHAFASVSLLQNSR